MVQLLIGWLLVRFVFRQCGDVAVAAAAAAVVVVVVVVAVVVVMIVVVVVVVVAAAAASVAPKGKMWDGTRPKGGSFKRSKSRQSATSRVLLLSTG